MSPVPHSRRRWVLPEGPTPRELRTHPAVRNYTLFCLASLFLLVVCLSDRGLSWWAAYLPAALGAVTVLVRWGLGPPLVLVSLVGLLGFSRVGIYARTQAQTPTLMDLLLCMAVLAYALGHYRLLSLLRPIFPSESHRPGEAPDPAQRRSADLVSATEMILLGLAAPTWTVVALVAWLWLLGGGGPPLDVNGIWRVLRFVWLLLLLVLALMTVFAFRRMTSATPAESLLYLQDEVWRLTRREQGNINRWLSWTRQRIRRRKESG